jgi:pimeloyl-ACP methyl ester carboxylesterase
VVTLWTGHLAVPWTDVAEFLPAQAFLIEGMAVRNQVPGVGAPLIGRLRREPGGLVRAIGASLVLVVEGTLRDLDAGGGRLRLELRSPNLGPELDVAGRRVPVAHDLSAPMAYALSDDEVWDLAFHQFFREREQIPTGLYPEAPHAPGKIPVVLIHGTVSSPVVWAAAMNTLRADPVIRENFEFWLFIYRSGYPINYSAVTLRAHLRRRLDELRAAGAGDELDRLVVVGHSQGGLLAKLTAVEPGRALWDAVFNGDYEPERYSPEMRERLERGFFFRPVPEVRRVVFMATPHRGSDLTEFWPVSLVRRVLKAPQDVLRATAAVMGDETFDRSILRADAGRLPTSVEDMSPRSPWLLALAGCPLAAGVPAHSIIALKDGEEPPDGTDGVVPYWSAHLASVASEKIVRSHHGVQRNLVAIEELRRILRLHLEELGRTPSP